MHSHWEINQWADFLPSCLYSEHLFLLPFTSYPFSSCDEMTGRVINDRNPPVGPLIRTHTHTHTWWCAQNSNSSFMFHVRATEWCRLESPISMTTSLRIRVKNCHSGAIVTAPWFRRALKSGGKELGMGVEIEEFGSVGRIKGETEEWVMILQKITLPPHPHSF